MSSTHRYKRPISRRNRLADRWQESLDDDDPRKETPHDDAPDAYPQPQGTADSYWLRPTLAFTVPGRFLHDQDDPFEDTFIPDDDDETICYNCGCPGELKDPESAPGYYVCPHCGDEWDIYEPAQPF